MKYPIHNTNGQVLFEAEIECNKFATDAHMKRLAVLWAVRNKKRIAGANLRGVYLCGVNLNGADFRYAVLRDTSLEDADLSSADH